MNVATTKILNQILHTLAERDYWIGFAARVNSHNKLAQHLRTVFRESVLQLEISSTWKDILLAEVSDANYDLIGDKIVELTIPAKRGRLIEKETNNGSN